MVSPGKIILSDGDNDDEEEREELICGTARLTEI